MTSAEWDYARSSAGEGPRYVTGWGNSAVEIHRVGTIPVPVTMRLEVADHPPIVIDFARRTYSATLPFDRYPIHPGSVAITAEAVAPGSPAPFPGIGVQLDGLLWAVGITAFEGSAAPWLRPSDRYRLSRWPNFTELPHTMDYIRMTALLGAGFLSLPELCAGASVSVGQAQRILNALSLMGGLQVVGGVEEPTMVLRQDAADQPRGLFGRLRARLGL
ncbi:MAG: hypothetical protein HY996_05470 [Micrococcales bacterium]|nr:hypothetical protein [Micrococcales bacterium]